MFPVNYIEVLLEVAREEIGVRETSANQSPRIREYQSSTWLEPGAWPWCAAFVNWCLHHAAIRIGQPCRSKLPNTPRAFALIEWAERHGLPILRNPKAIAPGDVIVFHFRTGHHCGIASTHSDEHGRFKCIEGNTDDSGGRDGDGVYVRTRTLPAVVAAIPLNRAKPI